MKYKYLAIDGTPIDAETAHEDFEKLLDAFDGSITPICEVNGTPYWNREATREFIKEGAVSKAEWIKYVCPQLVKIHG